MWNLFRLFNKKKSLLSDLDKQLLVRAIQAAEKTTSGEIRVYVESTLNKKEPLQKAAEKFFKHKMNLTQQRNGVLIYVAVNDRKIAIYGDQGIHEKVGEIFWNEQVYAMITHFKNTNYVNGIVQVVEAIGKALTHHFPFDRKTDINELSDEIMIGK